MNNILPYNPPKLLFNGHLQTIFPAVFREKIQIPYQREIFNTPDGDFLDLDWYYFNAKTKPTKQLVILCHGLDGNSQKHYATGMAKAVNKARADYLVPNYRSCGGKINRQPQFYHAGATQDLDLVINKCILLGYEDIFLVGYSLGGNIVLKYLGEKPSLPQIKKAIAFSTPLDLQGSAIEIAKPHNFIYQQRFLKSLLKKVEIKKQMFPQIFENFNIKNVKSIFDFDEQITSKLNGFINAKDYYAKNSSIIFVKNIEVPTLIVNAKNDSFLSTSCFPTNREINNVAIQTIYPQQGGHCGFFPRNYKNFIWSEQLAIQYFFNQYI